MALRSSSDIESPRELLLRGVRLTEMMESSSKKSSSSPSARVAALPSASSRVMKAFQSWQYECRNVSLSRRYMPWSSSTT